MQDITRARSRSRDAGTPLPTVLRTLADHGVYFRRSNLVLIASAPGGAKSTLAATIVIKAGVPGLYFSADSDEAEQYSRAYSILTGTPLDEVLAGMEQGKTAEFDRRLAAELGHLRFDYHASPSLEHIEANVSAYAYVYGRYPEVIVVDNLRDVVADDVDAESYLVQENILAFLKDLARNTHACVLVLHHVTGEWENGDRPIPLSGLRGKVGKVPQLILTLYRDDDPLNPDRLGVAIVKNRGGPASAAGHLTTTLHCDLSRMAIGDLDDGTDIQQASRRVLEEGLHLEVA